MKIMDKILSFLGFEIEEDEKLSEKDNASKTKDKKLLNKNLKKEKNDFFILPEKTPKNEYINLKPKNQLEIQEAMNLLKSGENLIINFSEFKEIELVRAFDFVSGFCYSLNIKIEKLDEKIFKLTLQNNTQVK